MKKSTKSITAILMAGVMMTGLAACKGNNDPIEPVDPNPSEQPDVTEMSLYERADYLARAVDAHYATYRNDEIFVAGYYNALEGGTDSYANCYEYSSLLTMANKIYAVSGDDAQKSYYKTLLDGYVAGLDNFEGSGTYNSTHGRYEWTGLYGVHRQNSPKTGNVSVDMVYDDLMWIIRDFVEIYETTGDSSYITRAEHLTAACLDGWDSTVDGIGGIVWGPTYKSKHTCSNGPLISALCGLAEYYKDSDATVTAEETVYGEKPASMTHVAWENMVGMKKYDYYLYWAKQVYDFTWNYLRESDYTYADNLRHDQFTAEDTNAHGGSYFYFGPYTGTNEGTKFTYNTGSMISGAAWLYRLTGDESYLLQGRLMAEGAYHYFTQTVKVGGTEMQMYDCRASLLFNEVLMQGYLDLADAVSGGESEEKDAIIGEISDYVKVFKTSLNYAFGHYLLNRTLPQNYLQGWLYAGQGGNETFDSHKDVKDATASPSIMAMIVLYEKTHGEIK